MNEDFKTALSDYFEAWDLVDLLELKTDDIIDAFEDLIASRVNEFKDYIGFEEEAVDSE